MVFTDGGTREIEEEVPSTVPLTTLLAAQSGGQPVRKVGYFEKRGGPTNPAYKRRWLVLTEYGKCIYFAESRLSQSLGTYYIMSLCDFAMIQNYRGMRIVHGFYFNLLFVIQASCLWRMRD